jgi:hypothetical protein
MKRYIILSICLIGLGFASCEKDTDPGSSAVEPMTGDWWVRTYYTGDNSLIFDYKRIATFSTAKNSADTLGISDYENIFEDLQVKVSCTLSSLTFGSDKTVYSSADGAAFTVKSGIIIKNGTKSPSGAITDSIYFHVIDPYGDEYILTGYKHTGWEGDY